MQQCSKANVLFVARRMLVMEIVVESFDNNIQELTHSVEVQDFYLLSKSISVGAAKNER